LRTGGVHAALEAVNKAETQALALADDGDGHKSGFLALLRQFRDELISHVGDHPELRFGNEVILTREDLGSIYPRLLSSPSWEGEISFNRPINSVESEIMGDNYSHILSSCGAERNRLIETTNADFRRNARLEIYDPFSAERYVPPSQASARLAQVGGRVAYYDTLNDPTFMSREQMLATLAPGEAEPSNPRYIYHNVEEALLNFSGSREFTDNVRTIMNQMGMVEIPALIWFHFATQTGLNFPLTGLSLSGMRFTLTRVTEPIREGENPPGEVEYDFEIARQLDQSPPSRGASYPAATYQAVIDPKIILRLTHDTRTDHVTAKVIGGRVDYKVTRKLV
jgi:hypothetical protein